MKIFTKKGKFSEFNIDLSDKVLKSLKKDGINVEDANFVRKGLTTEDMKFDEGERSSIDYITTIEVDRDGDIVLPQGAILDTYKMSPIVLYGHNQNDLPIGRTAWIKQTDFGLVAKTVYASKEANPEAEKIFNLKKEGILTSKSIGFIPLEVIRKKDFVKINAKDFGLEQRHLDKAENIFTKWILLEHSEVNLPSNVHSTNIAISKGYDTYLNNICDGLDCDVQKEARLFFADMYDKSDAGITTLLEGSAQTETKNFPPDEDEGKGFDDIKKDINISISVTDNSTENETEVDPENEEPIQGTDQLEEDEKVEITAEYIHIPVKDPKLFLQNSFRTIDVSVDRGIKAVVGKLITNPGGGTVVQKYIFDKSKFTEGEAVEWVSNHKSLDIEIEEKESGVSDSNVPYQLFILDEADAIPDLICEGIMALPEDKIKKGKDLVNKIKEKHTRKTEDSNDFMHTICKTFNPSSKDIDTTFNKALNITDIPSIPSSFNYEVFSEYLEISVKDIFENDYSIPNVMIGSQLSAFKEVFSSFELVDERNFNYNGTENPLQYKTIQLTKDLSEEFLVEGTRYYKSEEGNIVVKFYPTWSGMKVSLYTAKDKSYISKNILSSVDAWVEKNNYLKGQKFTINGEFLSDSEIGFDDVILTAKNKEIVKRNINKLEKNSNSRGLMLIGPGGVGKTLTGKAIIKETDHTFIWASSSDFKDIGSVSGLSLAFNMARKLAPTVLFIEDIDAWIRGYTVDLLKTEMDGLKSNKGVITILTSNEPENFPDTLINRPGRFHHILSFAYPDETQRKEMLERWAKGADEDKIEEFVLLTEGFSGAHIKELVDYAKMLMEDEDITFGKALIKSFENMMEQKELIDSIKEGRGAKSLNIDTEEVKEIDLDNIENHEIDLDKIEVEETSKEIEFDMSDFSEILESTIKSLVKNNSSKEEKVVKKEKQISLEDIADLINLESARLKGEII